ncbi:MAG TPA: hypothetical protein VGQ17_02940 [Gemmatimonadales bacterium]|jgi:hypothetical protein|nr:hypothetical protein [Gemmatimonadales bacterium]
MTLRPGRAFSILLVSSFCACATLQQIAALRQVAFALAGIQDGRLAGVALNRIATYRDLTAAEVGRLALAMARDDLPLEFRMDVRAENPADNRATATMVRLAWVLVLDDKETIHGVLDSTYVLPPGRPVVIPLHMKLNLRQFFDGPAETLVNLAAGLAGLRADPARIAVRAVPTINTPLGPIAYPSPITIISRTVGGGGPP